jgi:hypothetical protein
MNTNEYLDKAKEVKGITSDYALAKELKIRPSAISNYRAGKSHFDDVISAKVAELIGIHAGLVMLDMHRQRASTPEEINVWKEIFQGFQALLLPAKFTPVYSGFNRRKQ